MRQSRTLLLAAILIAFGRLTQAQWDPLYLSNGYGMVVRQHGVVINQWPFQPPLGSSVFAVAGDVRTRPEFASHETSANACADCAARLAQNFFGIWGGRQRGSREQQPRGFRSFRSAQSLRQSPKPPQASSVRREPQSADRIATHQQYSSRGSMTARPAPALRRASGRRRR